MKKMLTVKQSNLTAHELRYLRLVTGQTDSQVALDRWLAFAGWYEKGTELRQHPKEVLLDRIKKRAKSFHFQ